MRNKKPDGRNKKPDGRNKKHVGRNKKHVGLTPRRSPIPILRYFRQVRTVALELPTAFIHTLINRGPAARFRGCGTPP